MTQPLIIEKTAERAEPSEPATGTKNLVGMSREEMSLHVEALGVEKFRAKQIWHWVYQRGVTDFDAMSNIAKKTRTLLAEHFHIARAKIIADQLSSDGTRKWLFEFSDGSQIETVYIPEAERGTLCISSQVGCTLACTFCHTGTQKLLRNLTTAEIIGQVMCARDGLNDWMPTSDNPQGTTRSPKGEPSEGMQGGLPLANAQRAKGEPSEGARNAQGGLAPTKNNWPPANDVRRITNIVFMGMGEPMFNYDHVAKACAILTDGEGIALSRRRVTISTSGVVPRIYQMSDELGVNLAISLHALRDDLRDEIVPINRKYKLAELLESMRYFHTKHPSRRIMIEYVMLQEVNDTIEDAHQLAQMLQGIPVKVNLIPFNPWPGSPYQCSSNNRIHAFKRVLQEYNLSTPIRKTRGDDILAACGQLKSETERKKGEKIKRN